MSVISLGADYEQPVSNEVFRRSVNFWSGSLIEV